PRPSLSFLARAHHRDLPSFPTRRSSDLEPAQAHALAAAVVDGDERLQDAARRAHERGVGLGVDVADDEHAARPEAAQERRLPQRDRKSTRLNSSHVKISYAVFCLKKKKR